MRLLPGGLIHVSPTDKFHQRAPWGHRVGFLRAVERRHGQENTAAEFEDRQHEPC